MHFSVLKENLLESMKEERIALSLVEEVSKYLETFRSEITTHRSSIFELIGGERKLNAIVAKLFDRIQVDSKLNGYFKKKNVKRIAE